jgi:23S rRNA pseudouridine2604 synthase
MEFPIRINKYLAEKNISTRRGADDLIKTGKVKINGRVARLGDKVNRNDKVEVGESARKKEYVYIAYSKPFGIITHSPQKGEKSIKDIFKFPGDVFPVGRLDKDSEGLIILTNDGRITDKLLNPKFFHEKEYSAEVDKPITNVFLLRIKEGLKTGNFKTRPAKIRKTDQRNFDIILTEGQNRQIRRMCAALGYKVERLKRVRIMNIKLGNLKANDYRKISGKELERFLSDLGIK